MRITVDIPDEQLDLLAAVCRRDGVSRAEVVRRAVAAYLEQQRVTTWDDAFGIWREREIEGVAYQRKLRSEWPYRPVLRQHSE